MAAGKDRHSSDNKIQSNMELQSILDTTGQVLYLLGTILGIMALIYIGLSIINQKRNRQW